MASVTMWGPLPLLSSLLLELAGVYTMVFGTGAVVSSVTMPPDEHGTALSMLVVLV